MRKLLLIFCLALCAIPRAKAQSDTSNSNVKIFVDSGSIKEKNPDLDEGLRDRLFSKMQQIINKTGIAEVGYSTFLVSPKLDVLEVTVDQTGVGKVFLAECELSINIERTDVDHHHVLAVLNSHSKKVLGSGSTKEAAIRTAVNSISTSDRDWVNFIVETKQKIADYFKSHCQEVIKQAQQALALNQYEEAISLYFSVPINAPCYEEARQRSLGVYNTYMGIMCEKQLIRIKGYVAMGLEDKKNYEAFLDEVKKIDPTTKCFAEAAKEIEKVESRFTAEQKESWEFVKKQAQNNTDVNKERYKAMDRINQSYQPSQPAQTVIITH